MTTSEQQQQVENNSNFAPSTLESLARAHRVFHVRAALFQGLSSEDPVERLNALEKITQLVKSWAKACYPSETAGSVSAGGQEVSEGININENIEIFMNSPWPDGSSGDLSRRNSADENSPDDTEKSEEENKEKLRLFILTMLRLSIDCPFSDVRSYFKKCLKRLRSMNVPVPTPINSSPSFYIAPEEIITLEWPSDYTNNTLTQSITRSITPSGCSSSCSSLSSSSSSFSEELPRIIQQPLTPSTPLCLASPPSSPVGRQPDEIIRKMLINTFSRLGRISHFYRVLAYFPSFMERYQESYNSIVRSPNGPISLNWRFYIGIMAASQYKCQYVVSKLTDDFLSHGGNRDWLQGLQHAPIKIRNLALLNSILAHQPWRLRVSHIGALIKGSQNPQDNWTIAEIVQVILIFSTFHSLSSYVLGCGIVPEYDSIGGNCEMLPPTSPIEESGGSIGILESGNISSDLASGLGVTLPEQSQESNNNKVIKESSNPIPIPKRPSLTLERSTDVEVTHTTQLIKRLNQRNKEDGKQINYASSVSSDSSYSFSKIPGFENVDEETFTDETDASSPFLFSQEFFSNISTTPLSQPTYNPPPTEDFSRFLDPSVEYRHEDFVVNCSEYSVFKLQDYCWETHGVVTVNNYLPGVGEILDQEFTEIRDLTDYRLFHSYKSSSNIDLDTKPLRQAIWYYVQRLSGLLKDDYDYRDINTFLNKKIKVFLKKVCCTPEEIRYNDWKVIGFRLREEEKCHVNLIAVEARKQAELVYGLSCVMRWDRGEV
ncbi:PA26 p53-induced protein [Glomus cerebriforme]|uniref:PA26 p53-induced protein n=1 Tax=Glomus cerebriforme TaxID=658196 RepID=A0A397TLK3_9GLOM|nr:PA26 p53-induced protein [Glomus cerebriforme]